MAILTDDNVLQAINDDKFTTEFTVIDAGNSGFLYLGSVHFRKELIGKKVRFEAVIINE